MKRFSIVALFASVALAACGGGEPPAAVEEPVASQQEEAAMEMPATEAVTEAVAEDAQP